MNSFQAADALSVRSVDLSGPLAAYKTIALTYGDGDSYAGGPSSGNSITLFDFDDAGIVTALHFDVNDGRFSRDGRLRVFVDNETCPSIDMELGTLFLSHLDGGTNDRGSLSNVHLVTQPYAGGNDIGFSGNDDILTGRVMFPIPFTSHLKVTLFNAGFTNGGGAYDGIFASCFYWDGATSDYRLRSCNRPWFNKERVVQGAVSTLFSIANCAGHLVGLWWVTQGVSNYSYLDRNFDCYLDGEGSASFHNNGSEDLFTTGWYGIGRPYFATPTCILAAANNSNRSFVAFQDFLAQFGGIKFTSALAWKLQIDTAITNSDHDQGYGALYYIASATTGLPTAPTRFAVTGGSTQGAFTWGRPDFIGNPSLTSYHITLSPNHGSADPSAVAEAATITGLTNGTPYTATIRAVNANGNSAESASVGFTPS